MNTTSDARGLVDRVLGLNQAGGASGIIIRVRKVNNRVGIETKEGCIKSIIVVVTDRRIPEFIRSHDDMGKRIKFHRGEFAHTEVGQAMSNGQRKNITIRRRDDLFATGLERGIVNSEMICFKLGR